MYLVDRSLKDFSAIREKFQWRVPEHLNIAHYVCDRHSSRSDRTAVFYENDHEETQSLTFGQLQKLSNQFAHALTALGVQKGDRVALILSQRLETVIAHIAIYRIGAIALPLSVLFGDDALRYRIDDSASSVVIHDNQRTAMLQSMREELASVKSLINVDGNHSDQSFWGLLESASSQSVCADTRSDDPALLIYTSGTTGPPKGALIGHRALIGNLPGFELSHNFFPQPDDLFWTPADWAWTGGLWDALLPSLYYGVPVLAYEGGKFDPEKALYLMEKYQVRNSFIPPTALKMMRTIPNIPNRYELQLRSVMSAGESVGEELIHWGTEILGFDINEMWGQTEFNYIVGNCAAVMPVRPGSIGKPYPGHDVEVIAEDGSVLPTGDVGELAARKDDPVQFIEYWNNPPATRDKFNGDWFCTGDLGYRDEQGYLWFVGRKDDVISSAGYRIGPGEIEDVLIKHPAVIQAAVIGVPDELRGQRIKAFVILAPDSSPSRQLRQEIQLSVKHKLAAYEYPREIEFIDQLPMTTTGKVRRIELRQREANKGINNS